ncbi:MAG: hypothetical protein R6V58_07740 [Planctomycetota bacterium]
MTAARCGPFVIASTGLSSWQIWTTALSLFIGLTGAVLMYLSLRHNRKYRVLDSLSGVLREFATALRVLHDAKTARRKAEQLRLSFPNGGDADRAANRVNELTKQYRKQITDGEEACRQMEIELAANSAKFPGSIRKVLYDAREQLFRFGQLVDNGTFDAADVQEAKLGKLHVTISKMARGWEMSGLLRLLCRRAMRKRLAEIRREDSEPEHRYRIGKERMDLIMEVLDKRMTAEVQSSFAVHPPRVLVENPSLLGDALDPQTLADLEFLLVFQDGKSYTFSFVELMVLTHQTIFVALEMQDLEKKLTKGGFGRTEVRIDTRIDPNEIMRLEMVKVLVEKIELSPVPAEALHDKSAAPP